ncbi:MAG TPA: hypothetical protein VJB97_02420 [Candidatus Paceibacterota bacterium]
MSKFSAGRSKNVIDLRRAVLGGKSGGHSQPPRSGTRVSALKMRRRRIRAAIALCIVLILASAVYGVHWISYMPRLTVQTVTVEGTERLEPQLVRAYAEAVLDDGSYHFLARDNILLYPREIIEHGIEGDFPRVKNATVGRASILSNVLVVSVEERSPYALWCEAAGYASSTACFVMDDGGFLFARQSALEPGLATAYVFEGGLSEGDEPVGRRFAEGQVHGVLDLLRELETAGFAPLGAHVVDERDYTVPLASGYYLKLSFGSGEALLLVHNLQLVLEADDLRGKHAELEYVDLRFGNRVYYKMQGRAETL